jgi:uncharacterized protein (TIGR03089 family)
VSADNVADAGVDDVYALSLAPLGLPFHSGPPPGTLDFAVEVRQYGDHFSPGRLNPDQPALSDGTTHAELVNRAAQRGLPPGVRLLIDADATPDPLDWLVAPIVASGSIVLCRNLDPAKLDHRLAGERATLS